MADFDKRELVMLYDACTAKVRNNASEIRAYGQRNAKIEIERLNYETNEYQILQRKISELIK